MVPREAQRDRVWLRGQNRLPLCKHQCPSVKGRAFCRSNFERRRLCPRPAGPTCTSCACCIDRAGPCSARGLTRVLISRGRAIRPLRLRAPRVGYRGPSALLALRAAGARLPSRDPQLQGPLSQNRTCGPHIRLFGTLTCSGRPHATLHCRLTRTVVRLVQHRPNASTIRSAATAALGRCSRYARDAFASRRAAR